MTVIPAYIKYNMYAIYVKCSYMKTVARLTNKN